MQCSLRKICVCEDFWGRFEEALVNGGFQIRPDPWLGSDRLELHYYTFSSYFSILLLFQQ